MEITGLPTRCVTSGAPDARCRALYSTFEHGAPLFHTSKARWYDPEVGRFVGRDIHDEELNRYVYALCDPLRFIDPDGKTPESVGEIAIPDYVDEIEGLPPGLVAGDRSSCKCTAADIKALKKYLQFCEAMVDWCEGERADKPPSKGVVGASTECTGGAGSGRATIEIKNPWNKNCFDRCMLRHELVHAQQCNQKGKAGYEAMKPREKEKPAYRDTVKCIKEEIRKLGGEP
jgi:RHS repeat-associated protein